MNSKCFKLLSIGVAMFTLWSCTGNNDAQQQQMQQMQQQLEQMQQQMQQQQAAPVDSTMPQAQPQAQAQPAADQQAAAPATTAHGLPAAITAFIKQHFPNASIVGVEPDYDNGGLEYDVYLSDGTKVDFDANNQWDQVESMRGVPAFFIPKAIASYVRGSYHNLAITKINKEYHGYEIELANGLDLNFDRSGRFMGIDD